MEASLPSTRDVFTEALRAVLETWPVLQIAVDNGFGGVYSKQKADWMVDAVQQYFQQNDDLQQYEVEDFLADLMNNEFDTVVDDGSLPQVASKICQLFKQCEQGMLLEVRSQTAQIVQRKSSGRAKATPAQLPADEEEEESEEDERVTEEPMECEEEKGGSSSTTPPQGQTAGTAPSEDAEDGWTVVRRKK
ncbi:pre-rRNA-processing protein TSR2 homolog isoform X2 [Brienomyrus brachyistius]|uniref:pre-rRNA-processing protein TSR2 homolog isoform X2 n=1 Tax=Brienomyrus brachyistius TaxID=42636 RepID=UPI0020B2CD1D|nr:pre-rRNA-processing protein TSR2 homolog isoform X2 [Brienomyrus brachyistius]